MAQPIIYCIYESDAPQHVGKIQDIALRFQEQDRISKFIAIDTTGGMRSLRESIENNDVVIVLLTIQLEQKQIEIGQYLSELKTKFPEMVIIEIIIDNIQYENEYITFPSDLIPIRDRSDMDQAWIGIEKNLDQLIPRKNVIPWKKYLISALIAAAVILLVVFLPKLMRSGPEPEFNYSFINFEKPLINETAECYFPCMGIFTSASKNYDSLRWDFSDTIIANNTSPRYWFVSPGEHVVTLTAIKGEKRKSIPKTINVKAPPFADFEIKNNGCIAPCQIEFVNHSENGKSFTWNFGDDTPANQEENPKKEFAKAGEFKVSLEVKHANNMKSDTVKLVTIRENPSPFAQFTIKTQGKRGEVPRNVNFENTSKNADQFIWDFGDGEKGISNAASPHTTHLYKKEGTYVVELKATRSGEPNITALSFYIGPLEKIVNVHVSPEAVRAINTNKELKAKVMRKYRTP